MGSAVRSGCRQAPHATARFRRRVAPVACPRKLRRKRLLARVGGERGRQQRLRLHIARRHLPPASPAAARAAAARAAAADSPLLLQGMMMVLWLSW